MTTPDDLLKLLHGEFSSLVIGFNDDHAPNYATAQQFSDEYGDGRIDWASEEERQKALRENSVWTIQWYPHTPVGFTCVGASSFEAAARYALSKEQA